MSEFKLYTLNSKNYLRDMIFESILNDHGVLMPRHDLALVTLNKRFRMMEILEKPRDHFLEYAQITDGPIVGYDADKIQGSLDKPLFAQKTYGKKYSKKKQAKIYSHEFAENICQEPMQIMTSFALANSALHALLQSDLRFHSNPRKDCHDPIARDVSSGNFYVMSNKGTSMTARMIELIDMLNYKFRPDVIYRSSHFVLKNKSGSRADVFEWLPTIPAALHFYDNPKNMAQVEEFLKFWGQDASKRRVDNRLLNLFFVIRQAKKLFNEKQLEEIERYGLQATDIVNNTPKALLSEPEINIETPINKISYHYYSTLVEKGSHGEMTFSKDDYKNLLWRNAFIYQNVLRKDSLAQKLKTKEEFNPLQLGIDVGSKDKAIISMLMREDESESLKLIFTERIFEAAKDIFPKGEFYLEDRFSKKIYKPKWFGQLGNKFFKLHKQYVLLDEIHPNELVRVYYFEIPKEKRQGYRYLVPVVTQQKAYYGVREYVLLPREKDHTQSKTKYAKAEDYFVNLNATTLQLKANTPVVDSTLVIPANKKLEINQPRSLKFSANGCLMVYGGFEIANQASLKLSASESHWSGIHFDKTPDLKLQNINIEDIGNGAYGVVCDGRKFSGGLSIFNSKAQLKSVQVFNSQIEDALHFLRSDIEIESSTIDSCQSDAIDSDFSNIRATGLNIRNSGGDGLDISGSHAIVNRSQIGPNEDKAISVGENSMIQVKETILHDAKYGIAVKDSSLLELEDTVQFKNCKYDVEEYNKKPYFGPTKVERNASN